MWVSHATSNTTSETCCNSINRKKSKTVLITQSSLIQSTPLNDQIVEDISIKLRSLLTMATESKQNFNGMQQLERINNDLRKELATQTERLRSSEQKNLKLQKKVDDQLAAIVALQGINDELELNLTTASISKVDQDKAAAKLQNLQAQINCLMCERRKIDEQRKRTEDQIYQMRQENDGLKQENLAIKKDLQQANNDRAAIASQLDQYQARMQNANQIEQRLSSELNQNTDSVCAITAENTRLKLELEELRAQQETTQITYNELHCKMVHDWSALRKRAEERKVTIRLNEQTIDTITSNNEKMAKRIAEMESNIFTLRETISSLRERLSNLGERETTMVRTYQEDMAKIKLDVHRFQGLLTDLHRDLMASQNSNSILSKAHDCSKKELNNLKAEYTDLKNDYKDLKCIKEQAIDTLASTKCLVLEQHDREQRLNQKLAKQSEHIETLLHDRKNLMLKVQQFQRDYGFPENDTSPIPSNTERVYYTSDRRSYTSTDSRMTDNQEADDMETHRHMQSMVQTVRNKRVYIQILSKTVPDTDTK